MSKEDFKLRQERQAIKAMARAAGFELADRQPMQKADGYAYQMAVNDDATEATINIYGDITEWAWEDWGEMDANILSRKLEEMPATVQTINVRINSYGGSVKEGLAIYNLLRSNGANVVTYCDGMACSIASVIFCAGDERIMSHASELLVHNAWSYAIGNAAELRKAADDLDKATSLSIRAYLSRVNITEKKLRELMDAETWLTPEEALEMGFATEIEDYSAIDAQASARTMQEERPEPVEEPIEADPIEAAPEPTEDDPETAPNPETDPEPSAGEEGAQEGAHIDWSAVKQALTAAR